MPNTEAEPGADRGPAAPSAEGQARASGPAPVAPEAPSAERAAHAGHAAKSAQAASEPVDASADAVAALASILSTQKENLRRCDVDLAGKRRSAYARAGVSKHGLTAETAYFAGTRGESLGRYLRRSVKSANELLFDEALKATELRSKGFAAPQPLALIYAGRVIPLNLAAELKRLTDATVPEIMRGVFPTSRPIKERLRQLPRLPDLGEKSGLLMEDLAETRPFLNFDSFLSRAPVNLRYVWWLEGLRRLRDIREAGSFLFRAKPKNMLLSPAGADARPDFSATPRAPDPDDRWAYIGLDDDPLEFMTAEEAPLRDLIFYLLPSANYVKAYENECREAFLKEVASMGKAKRQAWNGLCQDCRLIKETAPLLKLLGARGKSAALALSYLQPVRDGD